MLQSHDGISYRRVGGKKGDRTPATGYQRPGAIYTAAGGETTLDIAALNSQLVYTPNLRQISVYRGSGGKMAAGADFYEISPTSIQFATALLPGEIIEIEKNFNVTGIAALPQRQDYHDESGTAGQTTITVPWSWRRRKTGEKSLPGAALYIDGQLKRLGVDYTETDLGGDNTNEIVLTSPLVGGENVIVTPHVPPLDSSAAANSFNGLQIQQILDELAAGGTQAFVDQSATVAAPFTTIENRSPLPDVSQSLFPSFGIDRWLLQAVQEKPEERAGSERVWGVEGDIFNRVRLVGPTWSNYNNTDGPALNANSGATTNSYFEITFYGTGLNILGTRGSLRDVFVSVDGAAETFINDIFGNSSVIEARHYGENMPVTLASGLALGWHTVKVRVAATNFVLAGYEVLHETTQLSIRPGTAYRAGKKITLQDAVSTAYNSGFESGVLGTRGGHVLVYLKADGTIGKAVTPTNAAQQNLGLADHTNEELIRSHFWREFGAGRTDDFSTAPGSSSDRFFTLNDGSTSLFGNDIGQASQVTVADALQLQAPNAFVTIHFIGTGLDIIAAGDGVGVADPHEFFVDGISVGILTGDHTLNKISRTKIVSGLPYGSHTVKINRNAVVGGSAYNILHFHVYGPKKPTLPAGAVEIGEYFILGDFVANATTGINRISTGVIRKTAYREFIYQNGTGGSSDWTLVADVLGTVSGVLPNTNRGNAYHSLSFFGTGFDFRHRAQSGTSNNVRVTVNGVLLTTANFPGVSFSTYPAAKFNAATGILDMSDAGTVNGAGFVASGFALDQYLVKFENLDAGEFLNNDALDIITPIHTPRFKVGSFNNAAMVGSQGLLDNRALNKLIALPVPNWVQVQGVTSVSTTATTPIPLNEMHTIIRTEGGPIEVHFTGEFAGSGANSADFFAMVNGVPQGLTVRTSGGSGGVNETSGLTFIMPVAAGVHFVQIFWVASAGTVTAGANGTRRLLTIKELKA